MPSERYFLFPPFMVDTREGSLRRDSQEIVVRAKTFALLCYLLDHAGQLVSKDELLENVWAGTYVNEGALTVSITELRKALGDDPKNPRFIVTVPKRGYRFIAEVQHRALSTEDRLEFGVRSQKKTRGQDLETRPVFLQAATSQSSSLHFVGREDDLAHLQHLFAKASTGQRQIVFVTGEPGIGKTTLVDTFLFSIQDHPEFRGQNLQSEIPNSERSSTVDTAANLQVAVGQCIEHYGAGEAYLPILDALGQLCRAANGARCIDLLRQHAPTWLVQMPSLLSADDVEAIQKRVVGATRERMLREMTEALEAITTDSILILVLEDLHWSDYSTLDLLSFIARRQLPTRLMILGTYRPGDVLRQEHPLRIVKQELHLHGLCEELTLASLTTTDVEAYLTQRFPDSPLATALGPVVYQRTEGNPLFMVNVVQDFLTRGIITQREGQWAIINELEQGGVPVGLRQFIEQYSTRIKEAEREVLEAASVVGRDFSVAAVAAALRKENEEVETLCTGLVRRSQFLQASEVSTWPDGTVTASYRFLHALYQEVLYEQVSAGRRAGWHRQIGERIEGAYGTQTRKMAAELAVHFERGQDIARAVHYLWQAGENAIQQNAHVDAIRLLNHAIALLQTLPDSSERAQQELGLYLLLRTPLAFTKGYVAPELEQAYLRACELCRQVGHPPQLFMVLGGPYALHLLRGELLAAYKVGEERMVLAESLQFDLFLQVAHLCLGGPSLFMGHFRKARMHLEQSLALYKPQQLGALGHLYDPGVMGLTLEAFVLWIVGYPDQALQRSQEALTLARDLSHPFSLAYALGWATRVRRLCGEQQNSEQLGEEWSTLCLEHGFSHQLAMATITRGWRLIEEGCEEEGFSQIQRGLADYRATREELGSSAYLILLAEAYGKLGKLTEGHTVLIEAEEFIRSTEERFWEAEWYRLKGELTLAEVEGWGLGSREEQKSKFTVTTPHSPIPPSQAETQAEAYFREALSIAQHQQAKSLELRATMSLAKLWQQQGKGGEAYAMLAATYAWFTEGFATKDLREAKMLLLELRAYQGGEASASEMTKHEPSASHLRLVVNKHRPDLPSPLLPKAKRGRK